MLSKINSATCVGIDAYPVEIEVDVSNGLPQVVIVGLPDQAVRESKERVRSALKHSGFPLSPKKITINLAPADVKKEGPAYDLPIALGILASSGFIKKERLGRFLFAGELALDGSLRPVKGVLPIAMLARRKNISLVVPEKNAPEVAILEDGITFTARSLKQVIDALNGEADFDRVTSRGFDIPANPKEKQVLDFADVKGQFHAKRAVEIAASGFHNLLLIGPPGAGKTMIAKRIPSVLPDLNRKEYLEVAKIYSVAGLTLNGLNALGRPFRNPHHTISQIGLVGGGSFPKPGEISLAHNGVLFLDEFPEFRRDAIEALRSPIEEGWILVARAKMNFVFPAQFLTVCAMNPCPCGYLTSPKRACQCNMAQIQKYHQKISGPILDRMDLHVEMPAVEYEELVSQTRLESSENMRRRVLEARTIQAKRFHEDNGKTNSLMSVKEIKQYCAVSEAGEKLLEQAMKQLELSARGYHKILKVARTISDLAGKDQIEEAHIAEAIQYRTLDRNWFGS